MNDQDRPSQLDVDPEFCGLVGVARRDITPPVGIHARQFAARKESNTTTGTHLPLLATALVVRDSAEAEPLVLVSVDASWFKVPSDEFDLIRGPILEALPLDEARLIIAYSHTHASCSISSNEVDKEGGDRILPYVKTIRDRVTEAIQEAMAACAPATVTWATGRCNLASNRDQVDPASGPGHRIAGYNPAVAADDTLSVARVTRDGDDAVLATVVNYACHPITLGWQNRLASPDYVGVLRQVVEQHTGGAPCLFLLGASGELAPRRQYTGDLAIAMSNGRQLGHATLSALHSMLKPKHQLAYAGIVESGASLGVWEQRGYSPATDLTAVQFDVDLPLKPALSEPELRSKMEHCEDLTEAERIRRELMIRRFVGYGKSFAMPAWIWKLGRGVLVAQPNEAYCDFQTVLRSQFPGFALMVMNVANGWCGYLTPPDLHDLDLYPVWQSPFDRPALPRLIETCTQQLQRLLRP